MKVQNIRQNLRVVFVMAITLCFLAFSNAYILFAAAPTVTTGAVSSITKTTATIDYTISNDGGKGISTKGIEYGTTTAYGSSANAAPFRYDLSVTVGAVNGSAEGELISPYDLVIDSSGDFLFADTNNNRIQKIDSLGNFVSMFGWGVDTGANSFEICTVTCQAGISGSGNGQFNLPSAITLDTSGNIYVMDASNSRVQKFNSAGAYQSQFGSAGTGGGQFSSSLGLEVDSSGNIYVADTGNYRIQKFNSAGVFQFMFGWGVDTGANSFEICTVTCQAGISGSGNGQFNFDDIDLGLARESGLAVDSTGNIYVADAGNSRIQKFNSAGTYQSQFGSAGIAAGQFNDLSDIYIDDNDDIYVVDVGEQSSMDIDRLQKFDANFNQYSSHTIAVSGYQIASLAGGPTTDSIHVLYYSPGVSTLKQMSGSVSLSSLSCGTTYHYRAFATNADGTSYGSDATFTTSACETPTVSSDLASNIENTTARLNGTHLTEGAAAATLRGFEYGTTTSYGSTVSSAGSLSVLAFGSNGIAESEFGSPYGIALDTAGNIFVSDTDNNRIQKFDEDGVFMNMIGWGVATGASALETCVAACLPGNVDTGDGALSAPRGLSVDNLGNIIVADYGNDRVQKFDSSGGFLDKESVLGGGLVAFSGPSDVDFRINGGPLSYVSDTDNSRVIKCFSFPGCATNYANTILNAPEGIDATFNLLIADTGDNQIARYDFEGSSILTTLSYATDIGGLLSPKGIVSTSDGTQVFVADSGHDRILKFASDDASSSNYVLKFVSQFGTTGSSAGQFQSPTHIAMNSDNEIFVADTNNHRIQKLSPFFSEDITNLSCGTTYHYRAFATNTDGTGYGSDQTFTTPNCGSITSSGGGGPDYGCTDPTANNYDASADLDDFTCDYTGIPTGCIDPDATNFDPLAVLSDGLCIYPAGYYGCMDPVASNYSATVLVDDGSCIYPSGPVAGCIDSTAINYNLLATVDDASCEFDDTDGPTDPTEVPGCTDTFAENFDPDATEDDLSCQYLLAEVYGCTDDDALNFDVNATVTNGTCIYPELPPWVPPVIIEIVDVINEVIRDVTGWTPAEQVEIYKDVAVTGLVVPSLFMLIAERSAIVSAALRLWNIIPTLLGFRRKRRPWGTVYDSVTKQPLDPVYVTLRNMQGGEVGTSITDLDGRYGFVTDMGEYILDAKKTDYLFPSVKMNGQSADELYANLYFGEKISVETDDMIINKNIPMDNLKFNWNEFAKAKNRKLMKFYSQTELFLARIAKIIFFAGFVASFLLIFLEPRMWNYIILTVYVIILILALIGVRPRKPGFIFEKATGFPLSFAVIRVFSALLKREIAHTIVGKTGKYHILVPKGEYYMTLEKKTGENTYEEVYKSSVFNARKGYIDKTLRI